MFKILSKIRLRCLKFLKILCYSCGKTPKRVTSGGAHLRSLVPRQHRSEETFLMSWFAMHFLLSFDVLKIRKSQSLPLFQLSYIKAEHAPASANSLARSRSRSRRHYRREGSWV